jgi:hypothetical protein
MCVPYEETRDGFEMQIAVGILHIVFSLKPSLRILR